MKTISLFILISLVISVGVMVFGSDKNVCKRTIFYRIGKLDPRFDLSEAEFREVIEQSEAVWEKPTGFNLFEYDATAEFTINLVFDNRQKATIEKRHLTRKLKRMESSHANIAESYEHWQAIYEQKKSSYDQQLQAYHERLKAYNQEVDHWNRRGGAPQHIYAKLEKDQLFLNNLQAKLEADRAYINGIINMLQSMQDTSLTLVSTYKSQIKTYNSLYGRHTRFNQGEYNGKAISIYQFNDTMDLRLVLAHELGHALGLGHVEDPTAVMHDLMGEQNLEALTLRPNDIEALKTSCGLI